MPSDSYLTCPGGTGKKLKFCCQDLVNEIPKLQRMIEGDQRLACLDQIERLEKKYPDRACLLALKLEVLLGLERIDQLLATARRFVEVHPQNPIALSQKALMAAEEGNPREALETFGRAMENCPQEMPGRIYQALAALAEILFLGGQSMSALVVLRAQLTMAPEDDAARRKLETLERTRWIPLLFRDDTYPQLVPPEGELSAVQRESYIVAMADMLYLRYGKTLAALEELARQAPAAPSVWRALGYVRAFAADTQGAVDALRKFASLNVPDDDAVEAEALAQLLAGADQVDHLLIEYPVTDADQAAAALVSSSQLLELPVDSSAVPEGQPPPRGVYLLFNRPLREGKELSVDSASQAIARIALHGKQTDREARLEVAASRWNIDAARSLLKELLPNSLGSPGEPTTTHRRSVTVELLQLELELPEVQDREQTAQLQADVLRQRVFEFWTALPLECLGGKTPAWAAGDASLRRPLAAAILLLELEAEAVQLQLDFNELRSQLGLPPTQPVDPVGLDINQVSLVRLQRLDVARLDDDQLTAVLQRAATCELRAVIMAAGKQMLERPQLAQKLGADRIYLMLVRATNDTAEAIRFVTEGRAAARAAKRSIVLFDIQELELHAIGHNIAEVQRVLNEIVRLHWSQPGVQEAVASILMACGIVPAARAGAAALGAESAQPPPQAPAPASAIWTPDSERAAAGKSALWTPGMD